MLINRCYYDILATYDPDLTYNEAKGLNMVASTDKKFWSVQGVRHDSYDSAEKHAKKIANTNKYDVVIMEAVAVATFPIANIEVNKLA